MISPESLYFGVSNELWLSYFTGSLLQAATVWCCRLAMSAAATEVVNGFCLLCSGLIGVGFTAAFNCGAGRFLAKTDVLVMCPAPAVEAGVGCGVHAGNTAVNGLVLV